MHGWFCSRPAFGPEAPIAHFWGRSQRTPICLDSEAHDPGGLVSLVAASESTPTCARCRAAVADAGGRELRA